MIKKYIISQLTHVSAWMGAAVIFSTMFLPNSITIGLGLFLIFTPDEKLNKLVLRWSPKLKEFLER